MDSQAIIANATRLIQRLRQVEAAHTGPYRPGLPAADGLQAQVADLMRTYAGPKSHFVRAAEAPTGGDGYRANILVSVLEGFIDHIESGLLAGVSPERQGQLDVVSDLLGQAAALLDDNDVHPAAAAVLVGASLEEFLRTWAESAGVQIGNRKPSLANFAAILRDADLLQKQDVKDIESWGGFRNHAAHGEWDHVADRQRIRLMLEGVNHFLRKHAP